MKFISHSVKNVSYSSVSWHESRGMAGVRYGIRRISLERRIALTKHARELLNGHEFLKAGGAAEQLEASLAELLVRKLYLEWALEEVTGLSIDGQPATVSLVIERGPEALANEIGETIRAELELSEEERKNS